MVKPCALSLNDTPSGVAGQHLLTLLAPKLSCEVCVQQLCNSAIMEAGNDALKSGDMVKGSVWLRSISTARQNGNCSSETERAERDREGLYCYINATSWNTEIQHAIRLHIALLAVRGIWSGR